MGIYSNECALNLSEVGQSKDDLYTGKLGYKNPKEVFIVAITPKGGSYEVIKGNLDNNISLEGEEPREFEAVRLAAPTISELRAYTGEYYSDELRVTYRVALEDGKLYLLHENPHKTGPKRPFLPTFEDRFLLGRNHLHFFRDERGDIDAFTMNAGRVRNIRFSKK